jgi:hypothetical protein
VALLAAPPVLKDPGRTRGAQRDGRPGRPRLGKVKGGAGGGRRQDEKNGGRQAGAAPHSRPEVQVARIEQVLKELNNEEQFGNNNVPFSICAKIAYKKM